MEMSEPESDCEKRRTRFSGGMQWISFVVKIAMAVVVIGMGAVTSAHEPLMGFVQIVLGAVWLAALSEQL